ncbi:hypothetical protein JX265_001243 [Neoarthrinium moseri]|uniref:Uncharacterized protein n=1 Tax=Neoarthrinium moseri TaxID=1658444 RepID=A0A9P9WXP0_9PEZI|nr:hypothetical protein JX266_005340 [Neoarthrinium moseri]KAI1881003.1 hypothetical protein JX265_001243 [Neoarthrinium moseri]
MPKATRQTSPPAAATVRREPPATRNTSTKGDDSTHYTYVAEDAAWKMRLWRRGGGCMAHGQGSYGSA